MISITRLRDTVKVPTDKESLLASTLAAVIETFERETGLLWRATPEDGREQTIIVDSSGEETLFLDHARVDSIDTVEQRSATSGSDFEEIAEGDWIQDGRRGVRSLVGRFRGIVRVTYSGGYANDQAPADIMHAIAMQVQFVLDRTSADKLIVSGVANPAGGSVSYLAPDFHPLFKRTVDARKRRA